MTKYPRDTIRTAHLKRGDGPNMEYGSICIQDDPPGYRVEVFTPGYESSSHKMHPDSANWWAFSAAAETELARALAAAHAEGWEDAHHAPSTAPRWDNCKPLRKS